MVKRAVLILSDFCDRIVYEQTSLETGKYRIKAPTSSVFDVDPLPDLESAICSMCPHKAEKTREFSKVYYKETIPSMKTLVPMT